jgi:hypothetical protein
MRNGELQGAGSKPVRQAIVVCLSGIDLPSHEEEHYIHNGDTLRHGVDIRKFAHDIGEDFGKWVRKAAFGRIKEGRDTGIGWPAKSLFGDTFGSFALASMEEA